MSDCILIGPKSSSSRLSCSSCRFGTSCLNRLGGTGVPMTQGLVLNSWLISGRCRVHSHKCEWCSHVMCVILSTVGSWQRDERIEYLWKCITQGCVGSFDSFLAGCVSLRSMWTLTNCPQYKPLRPSNTPWGSESLEPDLNLLLIVMSGQMGQSSINYRFHYWQKFQAQS